MIDRPILKEIRTTDIIRVSEIIRSCLEIRLMFSIHVKEYLVTSGAQFVIVIYAEETSHGRS